MTTPNGPSAATGDDRFGYGAAPKQPPAITAVSPVSGSTDGGTVVTIAGTGLAGASIAFGSTAATTVSCTATSCTATAPAGPVGTIDIRATTGGGVSPRSAADQFTYLAPAPATPTVTGVSPASGGIAGGTRVVVTGTHLAGAIVTFGLDKATAVTCTASKCTVTSPRGSAGVVDVRAETAGGTSAPVAADRFTYSTAKSRAAEVI